MATSNLHRNGLIASVVIMLGAPFGGLASTAFNLQQTFTQTESGAVDPSNKARAMSDGISSSMNGLVIGGVVSLIAFLALIFFSVRLIQASKQSESNTPTT